MSTQTITGGLDSPPPDTTVTEQDVFETHTDPAPEFVQLSEGEDWNDAEDRYEMIAEAAYYRAEQRGFEIGNEELDWLEAERELIERIGQDPSF